MLFWRWPHESQLWARDGLPVDLIQTPVPYRRPQPRESDPATQQSVRDKFEKFRRKRYVSKGPVLGLTSYFTVPKGDGDVRVVFDGTKSGLNASIWSPSFGLPSSSSLLATLEPGTWMADIDVGEMFYNFLLDPKLRPYCGVDLKPYCQEASSWERWERCVMGVKSSPYGCIKMDLLGDEVNKGNHVTPTNPFHFDQVCLNLPGDPAYNPSSPWVSKIVSSNQRIAGDVKTYVDDKRPTGYSYAHCRAVARRTASILGYLGMQDASRKRELPSLRAGAWSGVVCHTDQDMVTVLCPQDKWTKAKHYVARLSEVQRDSNTFNHAELESIRGFLIYVLRTYPAFTPFLKGLHLTLDRWRPSRDQEGWKVLNVVRLHLDQTSFHAGHPSEPPEEVLGVPRLASDLEALTALFSPDTPPRRVVRSRQVLVTLYGFGDASGDGFGQTLMTPAGIKYTYGLWGSVLSSQSSNYREFRNLLELVDAEASDTFPSLAQLVTSVERLVADAPPNMEMFLFTDNAVAEGAFYKGTSPSRALFDLVL